MTKCCLKIWMFDSMCFGPRGFWSSSCHRFRVGRAAKRNMLFAYNSNDLKITQILEIEDSLGVPWVASQALR